MAPRARLGLKCRGVGLGALVSISAIVTATSGPALTATTARTATIALETTESATIALASTATASIYGRVIERGTRRPLDGVEIAIGERFEASGSGGRFEIKELRAGLTTIQFTSVEHEPLEMTIDLKPRENRELIVHLVRLRYSEYEVTVRAKRKRKAPAVELELEEIAVIPGGLGDALKAVQNLPGTMRAPYGLGGLVVRGSPARDTKVFLEGHEIPALYHFGGLTSVVNTDTLSALRFHPGNFSSRYGRASAGVVELEMREGKAHPHGYLDVDLLDVSFVAEAEVAGGGLLISGRRSWVDTFFDLAFSGLGADLKTAPRTYDYQARYEHPLWGGKGYLMLIGADDRFEYVVGHESSIDRPTFLRHLAFHKVQSAWRWKNEDGWSARLSLSGGVSVDDTEVGDAFVSNLDQTSGELRAELGKSLFESLSLEAGIDTHLVDADLENVGPPPRGAEALVVRPNPLPDITSATGFGDGRDAEGNVAAITHRSFLAPAAWLEAIWDPWEPIRIVPGVRVDYHGSIEAVTIAPRVYGSLKFDEDTAIHGGFGLYHSPPPLNFLAETFGSNDLEAERALQASVGFARALPWSFELELELYWKGLSNLAVGTPSPSAASATIHPPVLESSGEGRSIGAELLIRRRLTKGLFGWIAYTLSRSERTPIAGEPMELFAFDQTHVLTLVLSYRTESDWTFGVRARYASGNPFAPLEERVFLADQGQYAPIFAETPRERLPAFFQVDVRIDKEWVFQDVIATAFVDIQNVTNHSNAEGYQYSFDYRERQPVRSLPILPTFGVRLQF